MKWGVRWCLVGCWCGVGSLYALDDAIAARRAKVLSSSIIAPAACVAGAAVPLDSSFCSSSRSTSRSTMSGATTPISPGMRMVTPLHITDPALEGYRLESIAHPFAADYSLTRRLFSGDPHEKSSLISVTYTIKEKMACIRDLMINEKNEKQAKALVKGVIEHCRQRGCLEIYVPQALKCEVLTSLQFMPAKDGMNLSLDLADQ